MRAPLLNGTLKQSPETSNTEALARVVLDALEREGVETEIVRLVDLAIAPGVSADEGEGDAWPEVHRKILAADILLLATPTWIGQPSSVIKRALERMDALLSETDEEDRPVAYNKVAGFVVTGNEDGAHHVIAELAQGCIDIGFTVPGQSWTYWNRGPGPGDTYLESDAGHDWSHTTARAAASNLLAVARALRAAPVPAPPA